MARDYDALVLDVDGTLLDDRGRVPAHTLEALSAARARGVVVMLATGRSARATHGVARQLDLDAPCVVLNGSVVYDAREQRLIEWRELPVRAVQRLCMHADALGLMLVVSRLEVHYVTAPRTGHQRRAQSGFSSLRCGAPLPQVGVQRATLMSEHHRDSLALATEARQVLDTPAFLTHFHLSMLAQLRDSPMRAVDVQPFCRGKAEALRVLESRYGIAAERVVAVGDADNDVEMLAAAGLGVAMGNASPAAAAAASLRIGDNNGDALARLVQRLFL